MVKRHTKPTQQNPQGGIIEKEGSVHVSNVMPLDPGKCDKPDAREDQETEDGNEPGQVGAICVKCSTVRDLVSRRRNG